MRLSINIGLPHDFGVMLFNFFSKAKPELCPEYPAEITRVNKPETFGAPLRRPKLLLGNIWQVLVLRVL
jgi:hypothetical protein